MDNVLGIDFSKLSEVSYKRAKHVWGYELELANTSLYSAKLIVLENDKPSSVHYHLLKDETFIVVTGEVILSSGNLDIGMLMDIGKRAIIHPNIKHQFKARIVPSVILEVGTNDRADDTYRVEVISTDSKILIDYGFFVRDWLQDNGYRLDAGAWTIDKQKFDVILRSISEYIVSSRNIGIDLINADKLIEALRNEGYVTTQIHEDRIK